jgi:uncharacterized membrane protein YbhN (UPF0104 family)
MTAREGVQFFAAGREDPRARRTVDGLRAAAWLLLLAVACVLAVIAEDLDRQLGALARDFPGVLDTMWRVGFWGAAGWVVVLIVVSLVQDRALIAGEALIAALVALGGAAIASEIVTDQGGRVFGHVVDTNGPPVFPHGAIAVTCAVLAVTAPYLTLPLRRFGRVLIVLQLVGSLFLGATLASGAVAAVAIGLLAGTLLHLVFGSPGGFPTLTRVRDALDGLGIEVDDLHAVALSREGIAFLEGRDGSGALQVKVYGRDAWEGEFVANAWRSAWYRDGKRMARGGRLEYVEHEGFVTVLARQAGALAPEVITAGMADNGDALIVTRLDGSPLAESSEPLRPKQLTDLWAQLQILHDAGLAHHRVDLDRVDLYEGGAVGFGDLASASVQARVEDRLEDRAQVLALGLVFSAEEPAVDAARTALGDSGVVELLPYLQEAAMPPRVRSAHRRQHIDLDGVRKRVAQALTAPDTELASIRRVTWKSLLSLVFFAIAGYTVIGMLSNVDLGSFVDALDDANWWWLAAALLIGQTPRVANGVSTMGSTVEELPLGPTTLLQFALCYLSLAIPSSAGRIAVTTRFYQRFGLTPAAAVSASVIDSGSEIIIQAVLFVLVFFISDADLGLSLKQDQLNGIATTALIVIVVLVVALAVAMMIPPARSWVGRQLRDARQALAVLRTPRKLLQLYGGNLAAQLLFAVTLAASARAFGYELPLSDVILVNTAVTLFAGLLPVPGGVGVMEAGLTLGLTRIGIPSTVAFPIALAYRFVVFYLPPIWGFVSFKWLTKHRYL